MNLASNKSLTILELHVTKCFGTDAHTQVQRDRHTNAIQNRGLDAKLL